MTIANVWDIGKEWFGWGFAVGFFLGSFGMFLLLGAMLRDGKKARAAK